MLQSLVVFSVKTATSLDSSSEIDVDDIAFSPLSIIVCFVSVVLFVAALIGVGLQKLPGPMPLASGCILAFSAACHEIFTKDPDAAYKPVMWDRSP
jgi:hypothetical protein